MSRNRRSVWFGLGLAAVALALFALLVLSVPSLFRRRSPQPDPRIAPAPSLHGQVLDDAGQVAGVRIRIQGQAGFTQTDADGRFSLPQPSERVNVTAWKSGHFIGFAPSDSQPLTITLRKLPTTDDPDYRWVDPTPGANSFSCGNCHEAIYEEWRASAHGHPGETSRFRDLFLGLDAHGKPSSSWSMVQEHPEGTEVCASCHDPAPLGKASAFSTDDDRHFGNIHCDFCHKIAGASDGEIGLAHGKRGLEFLRPREGQLIFGPLEDAARRENSASPFQRDGRLCASCHEGVVFGVNVYTTYSEWQASPAGRNGTQCQDCHMKPTGKMTNFAPDHGGVARNPSTIANHRFFDPDQRAMLMRCLKLNLTSSIDSSGVRAIVTVTAEGVGHRVPTGLPDRSLMLVVEAFDSGGKPVAMEKGSTLPLLAGTELTGKAGKVFAKILHDLDGRSPAPFWRAAQEFDDIRLEPGKSDKTEFIFLASTMKVSAKLVYRRFWPEVAKSKGWPDDAWVVAESSVTISHRN